MRPTCRPSSDAAAGASALLNDVLMQLEKERTGNYQAADDFSKD